MDFKNAYQQITKGEPHNAYLLWGEEDYFVEKLTEALLKRFVDPAMQDFNFTIFYGQEINDQQLVQALSEFPMMAERRVVICYEFDKIKMKNQDLLSTYFANPLASSIFIGVAEKVDLRKSLFKKMTSNGFAFNAKRLYDDNIPGWIRQKVQVDGYRISVDAVEELFIHIGSNLRDIVNELEKIYLFLDDKKNEINVDTIDKVCGFSREYSPFQLTNFMVQRNFRKVFKIGEFLTSKGEPLTKILSGLYFQFNKLWQIENLLRNKQSDREISAQLKIPVFFLKEEKGLAASVTNSQYRDIMKVLADTDRRVKGTGLSEKAVFNRMVFEIQNCLK